ncbi:MAG TPA: flagellar protein FlbB [Pseudorhodoplanes sp.]|nr:flagellar protein FlbB [Pseudorhodoplanes sp.]
MIKVFASRLRDIRLIPVVLVASACLFALKMTGIIANGGYTLGAGHLAKTDRMARESAKMVTTQLLNPPALGDDRAGEAGPAKRSWAQEMFGYPDVTGSVGDAKPKDATGSAPEDKKDEAKAAAKPAEPTPSPNGTVITFDNKPMSAAERAILERLQERRQELEQRAKELDLRETMLQATEKKLQEREQALKATEERINETLKKKDEADAARFKSIVTMYESMKAKEAAKIFDRLDIRLATEVASQINPRRMSDILAQMAPETAERLTVELANKNAVAEKQAPGADLPKIEGKPNGG